MKKASIFQNGLNERLRHHLISSGVDNYAESVKRAMRLEEDFKNNVRNENPPRNTGQTGFQQGNVQGHWNKKGFVGRSGSNSSSNEPENKNPPRMLKVEVRMLALHVEGFMEISHVSLKERFSIIVGRQDT